MPLMLDPTGTRRWNLVWCATAENSLLLVESMQVRDWYVPRPEAGMAGPGRVYRVGRTNKQQGPPGGWVTKGYHRDVETTTSIGYQTRFFQPPGSKQAWEGDGWMGTSRTHTCALVLRTGAHM